MVCTKEKMWRNNKNLMSQPLVEPQYALLNNCEPCQSVPHHVNSSGMVGVGMANVARVVSPQKDINNYTARIQNVLTHVNALNAGDSELSHPKSFMTGYTAGIARY